MMDDYITSRGITSGTSFTHVASIKSTSFQPYTIENMDQYSALGFYLFYQGNKILVESYIVPLDIVKTSNSTSFIQPAHYNGTWHLGQVYYSATDTIYGLISAVDSLEIYGIK